MTRKFTSMVVGSHEHVVECSAFAILVIRGDVIELQFVDLVGDFVAFVRGVDDFDLVDAIDDIVTANRKNGNNHGHQGHDANDSNSKDEDGVLAHFFEVECSVDVEIILCTG